MKPSCKQIITPKGEGYHLVGTGTRLGAWRNRRNCCNPAKENGYCHVHQDIGRMTIEAAKRIGGGK